MARATYILTVEGPSDFDFDLDDAAHEFGEAIEYIGTGEVVDRITLARCEAGEYARAGDG